MSRDETAAQSADGSHGGDRLSVTAEKLDSMRERRWAEIEPSFPMHVPRLLPRGSNKKVFPNWTGADAKFENLRAKGGFLVSAEMKGGRIRLVDPWTARGAVPAEVGRSPRDRRLPSGWTRGRTRNSGEATLERDFKPGEAASL